MNTQSRTERRTLNERRVQEHSPVFPFFDSKQTLVREDRRLIPNRRINNIQIQSSDKSEAANSRLFLWYKDKVCELMQGSPTIIVAGHLIVNLFFIAVIPLVYMLNFNMKTENLLSLITVLTAPISKMTKAKCS